DLVVVLDRVRPRGLGLRGRLRVRDAHASQHRHAHRDSHPHPLSHCAHAHRLPAERSVTRAAHGGERGMTRVATPGYAATVSDDAAQRVARGVVRMGWSAAVEKWILIATYLPIVAISVLGLSVFLAKVWQFRHPAAWRP